MGDTGLEPVTPSLSRTGITRKYGRMDCEDSVLCIACNAKSPLEHYDVLGADYGWGFCPACGQEVPLAISGDLIRCDPLEEVGGPTLENIEACFEHFVDTHREVRHGANHRQGI